MRAGKRTSLALALASLLGAGSAAAAGSETPAIPEAPGIYGIGDLALAPGMTLYLFRPHGRGEVEVGRMKVLAVSNGEVRLELISGSARMESGDHLELEASAPSEWKTFKE